MRSPQSKILEKPLFERYIKVFLLTSLGGLIVSIVILCCVPPISRDALVHHLTVPKLYLRQGKIYEIPSLIFSYYPMNLDLLYMIPLSFGNDVIPKFIHFSFALLTGWVVFSYLRRRLNTDYALLGVVFLLSIPIIVKLSITAYVDLGLIFFSTSSLFLLLGWPEHYFRLRELILSAICCGLAMGTKYNGLILFVLLTSLVPFLYSRYAQGGRPGLGQAAGRGILFAGIALAVFSPWMIRNYLWTNNPIYPLYDYWFHPQGGGHGPAIGLFTYRAAMYQESWWQMVFLPVRIFFQGRDGNPQYFDGQLNPFLFFLPFFAFYRIGRDPLVLKNEKKILAAFAALFFAFAFFTSDLRIRYISPIIPPLVVLTVFGVKRLSGLSSDITSRIFGRLVPGLGHEGEGMARVGRVATLLIIFIALGLNAHYIVGQYRYVKPFDYLTGAVNREEYIERYRREYPAIRFINRNAPHDARILFIFMGNRGYYSDRNYVFDMNDNRSLLYRLVKESKGPEGVLLELKAAGITHLLIYHDIFDKWVKSHFSPRDRAELRLFFERYARLAFFKWGYGVWVLEDGPSKWH